MADHGVDVTGYKGEMIPGVTGMDRAARGAVGIISDVWTVPGEPCELSRRRDSLHDGGVGIAGDRGDPSQRLGNKSWRSKAIQRVRSRIAASVGNRRPHGGRVNVRSWVRRCPQA